MKQNTLLHFCYYRMETVCCYWFQLHYHYSLHILQLQCVISTVNMVVTKKIHPTSYFKSKTVDV